MIRNNNQTKDKNKAVIDKGGKFQMNFNEDLSNLTARALYRCSICALRKYTWEYNKEKQRKQDDKHLIVLRNAAKSHQKRLQTYHDLIIKKKKQGRSMYTAHDWENYLIVMKRKDDHVIPVGKSSDVKPKIVELDRKIGHSGVMSICELLIYRYEPDH